MIQYYSDLKNIIHSDQMKQLQGGQIQKIYSTANYLSLAIRTPGKTSHLYIGRGAGHEGLYLSDKPPVSAIRQRERFLEYLRKHLSSCTLLEVVVDEFDRIAVLAYQKFGKRQELALFWKARKLYFAHLYQELPEQPQRLLLSWTNKSIPLPPDFNSIFEYFDEIGRSHELDQESSGQPGTIEEELEKELKQLQLGQLIHKPSFIQRKIQNIQHDLEKARQWKELQKFLDSGEEIWDYEFMIGDHKFKFDSDLNQFERRNLIYEKIKKLKRGEKILLERLQQAQGLVQENKAAQHKPLPITQVYWGIDKKVATSKRIVTSHEYKIIRTDFGSLAWGLTSQGNDQIRNKWATKEDWWFHLDGHKSSHLIVKSDTILSPNELEVIASILAQVSGFQGDWIPVIFTQVKNVKAVSGRPGMVVYKKQKHINCRRIDIDHFIKEDI